VFKQKPSYHYFSRAVLVTLCPVFLAVQIFFNFGATGNPVVKNNYLFGTHTAKNPHAVKSNAGTAHHRTGFRLNKHFQPESLPSYNLFVIERPVEYIDCRKQTPYSVHFFSSPLLEAQSLRGPPRMNDFL
jgi:hypothetical protein